MNDAKTQSDNWHRLDNVANLFPVITSKKQPNVYRISLNLYEDVDPEYLQKALEKILPWFPAFRTRLRHGMFWYYLEENPEMQFVAIEDDYPCRSFPPHSNNNFLFRVTYFSNRINLEVFHVLTDGTGALQFLRSLTYQYLMLVHPESFTEKQKNYRWLSENASNTEDSYDEHYVPEKRVGYEDEKAYRLRGSRDILRNINVTHIHIGTQQLLGLARSKGVSITQYLIAKVACSIYNKQLKVRPSNLPVHFQVPVNLRNMFESTTALNFFSSVFISVVMKGPNLTFDKVLDDVRLQFAEKVNTESMRKKISYSTSAVRNPFVKIVPLPFKNLFLKFMFEKSARSSTLTFTNISEVKLEEPFNPFISGASAMLSPTQREPLKCAMCSCKGIVTLSITSILHNDVIVKDLIKSLIEDGLDVLHEANGASYGDV